MRFFCSKDCFDICEFDITGPEANPTFTSVPRPWDISAFACSKLGWWYDREVRTPRPDSFIRTGGEPVSVSDDAAIDAAANILKEAAGKPILAVRGTGSLGYAMKYWRALLSRIDQVEFCGSGGVCDVIGCDAHEADYGVVTNPPLENLERASTIFLFGKNAKVTNPHLYAYLKERKKRGTAIVYIDPVKSETARLADHYIRINPATDGHLAAALLAKRDKAEGIDIEKALETAGIDNNTFETLHGLIHDNETAFIAGVGMHRYKNGKNSARWLTRLAVRTGNENLHYFGKGSTDMFASPSYVDRPDVPIYEASEKLASGYYAAVIVIAGNPVMSYPNSVRWQAGLGRTPMIAVDPVITRTGRLADVFIRVGGMFAQEDAMGSFFFPGVSAVRGRYITDGHSDTDVVTRLGALLDIPVSITDPKNIERVETPPRQFRDEDICLDLPMEQPLGFIRLISGSNPHWINSQVRPELPHGDSVTISHETADAYGITNGDVVRLSNDAGSITARVIVSNMVGASTAHVYKSRDLMSGWSNSVVASIPADGSAEGIGIYDTFVTISRINA